MKKLFLFCAAALASVSMWADPTYKSTWTDLTETSSGSGIYYTMLDQTSTTSYNSAGWLGYVNPTNGTATTLSGGSATFKINPATDDPISGTSGSYYKVGTSKAMAFYVTGISSIKIYAHVGSNGRHVQAKVNGGSEYRLIDGTTTGSYAEEIILSSTVNNVVWIYGTNDVYICAIKVTPAPTSTDPEAPTIISPASAPELAEISKGETKSFSVIATGYPAPTYAWYSCDDAEKTNPSAITGATAASYTTPNTLDEGTYYYYCVATNESGAATSPVFSLKVNPLGADLTAHTPGIYEKAQSSEGYGAALITYDKRQYETYYISFASSKLYVSAGNLAYNATGHYNLIDGVSVTTDVEVKGSDWFGIAANSYGSSGTTNKNQFNKNASTYAATLAGSNKVRLKVSGYDNFSFIGRDGANSGENMLAVKIDGESQTFDHTTTDNSIYSFDINTGEHYIEVTTAGGGSNRFRGFSLRLPEDETPTAISNTEVELKAVKRIENGVLVIEKDGKTYNVMGVRIR